VIREVFAARNQALGVRKLGTDRSRDLELAQQSIARRMMMGQIPKPQSHLFYVRLGQLQSCLNFA
jgi:hypothetical protein